MNIRKFLKAQLSSFVASMVDFSTTYLLVEVFGLWYVYSTTLGVIAGGITNCVINYRWVFHVRKIKKKRIFYRYTLTWLTCGAFNTWGTMLLTETINLNYIISRMIVSVCIALCWNYPMQRLFVFRNDEL